jgi:glutamate synthase domain-containing protein 3
MKAIILSLMLFSGLHSSTQKNDSDKIKEVIEHFITSTDKQNAEELAKTMYDEAKQFVIFGPRLITASKAEYLEQVKAKKVGGQPRAIEFGQLIMSSDNVAMQQLTATSSVIKFHYQVSLFRIDGQWKIISVTTEAEKL